MSPLKSYTSKLKVGTIKQDELQNKIVHAFEELFQKLNQPEPRWYSRSKQQFFGLYIYGSVGRGKTFLMDLFTQSMDEGKVRRIHFHNFMLWFHQQLRLIKKQQNPVDLVIKNLSRNISILCLDEFLVHDITDAMLLAKILYALDKYKVSLVTTSNVKPVNLYKGGLQRKKFLPAISWMQENMKIMELDGEHDYRIQKGIANEKWFHPKSKISENNFEHAFKQLVANNELNTTSITINKRQLDVIERSQSHIMFEFKTLCEQPRNANDFIQLTKQYDSIFMVIDEKIEPDDRNTARRFITLIDVLYDANTPLYVLSSVHFKDIYKGDELSFEMQRTVSRLMDSN